MKAETIRLSRNAGKYQSRLRNIPEERGFQITYCYCRAHTQPLSEKSWPNAVLRNIT